MWFVTAFLDHPNGGMGRYEVQVSQYLRNHPAVDCTIIHIKPLDLKLLGRVPWVGPRLIALARNNPVWFDLPPRSKGTAVVHLANQFMGIAIPIIRFRCFLRRQRIRIVTTVHDLYDWDVCRDQHLQDLYMPVSTSTSVVRYLTLKGLGCSDGIIVDSASMADAVGYYHPHLKQRISVARPGWTEELKGKEPRTAREQLGARILYVGSHHPRKNLRSLVGAVSLLRERGRDVELILAGAARTASQCPEDATEGISLLGELPYEEIVRLYETATVFACPSRFEGFGLPVLEAMGYGCPVVASDIPVFREVAGDAALYVSPLKAEEWADALERLLDSPSERDAMVRRGKLRASQMVWSSTLEGTVRAYEKALAEDVEDGFGVALVDE